VLPIQHAATEGDAFLVRFLVKAGAVLNPDCECVDDSGHTFNNTPLMLAAQNGHAEVGRVLIVAGVDVNQVL